MFEKDRDFIMLEFALSECNRALKALYNVELASIPKPNPRHSGGQVYEINPVFDSIRLALQLSANVSKMFWPPRNSARGVHLRSLTGISDSHPLHDRTLRNHIEHVDERLDKWAAISPRPFVAVEMIVPPGSPLELDMTNIAAIVYNQETKTIHLFGDSFSLVDIAINLLDVYDRINAVLLPLRAK